jgi:hypothetical protein
MSRVAVARRVARPVYLGRFSPSFSPCFSPQRFSSSNNNGRNLKHGHGGGHPSFPPLRPNANRDQVWIDEDEDDDEEDHEKKRPTSLAEAETHQQESEEMQATLRQLSSAIEEERGLDETGESRPHDTPGPTHQEQLLAFHKEAGAVPPEPRGRVGKAHQAGRYGSGNRAFGDGGPPAGKLREEQLVELFVRVRKLEKEQRESSSPSDFDFEAALARLCAEYKVDASLVSAASAFCRVPESFEGEPGEQTCIR